MKHAAFLITTLCIVSHTSAQTGGWLIESSTVVSPSNPTTTIKVWAWYDNPQRSVAFSFGNFDFGASDGLFSNPQVNLPTFGAANPGSTPGTALGSSVNGVFVGQLFGFLGFFANTDNPILAWSAEWTATDFTPRSVDLNTLNTSDFWVASISNGAQTQLYPQGFTPGAGMIEVVPSPASAMPLVVVGAMLLRRRR